MDRNVAFSRIRDVLAGELGVAAEKITDGADLKDDLELDSIDLVELLATLEDRIERSLDKDSLEKIRTVRDVVDVVMDTFDRPQSSAAS